LDKPKGAFLLLNNGNSVEEDVLETLKMRKDYTRWIVSKLMKVRLSK